MKRKMRLIELVVFWGVVALNPGCNEAPSTITNPPTCYRVLDHALADSSTLLKLNLCEIGDSLDPRIGSFSKLLLLEIRNSRLKYLPEEFSKLRRLAIINLENNLFTSIPKQIFEIQTLSGLIMPKNNIDSIPLALHRLAYLEHLDLQYNNLRHFSIENLNARMLRRLFLSGNRLVGFLADSNDFPQLQHLFLDNNPIPDSTKIAIRRRLPNVEIIF